MPLKCRQVFKPNSDERLLPRIRYKLGLIWVTELHIKTNAVQTPTPITQCAAYVLSYVNTIQIRRGELKINDVGVYKVVNESILENVFSF